MNTNDNDAIPQNLKYGWVSKKHSVDFGLSVYENIYGTYTVISFVTDSIILPEELRYDDVVCVGSVTKYVGEVGCRNF